MKDTVEFESLMHLALMHIIEAIALLDQAGQPYAAAHLQHAMDIVRDILPRKQ
jgi:hypothetical protein